MNGFESQNAANQSGFAHAIAAKQSHGFTRIEAEVDAKQDLTLLVSRLHVDHLQQAHAFSSPK